MSQLTSGTDVNTINAAARAIKELDLLRLRLPFDHSMAAEDDNHWDQARGHLLAIIEGSGRFVMDNSTHTVKPVNTGCIGEEGLR